MQNKKLLIIGLIGFIAINCILIAFAGWRELTMILLSELFLGLIPVLIISTILWIPGLIGIPWKRAFAWTFLVITWLWVVVFGFIVIKKNYFNSSQKPHVNNSILYERNNKQAV